MLDSFSTSGYGARDLDWEEPGASVSFLPVSLAGAGAGAAPAMLSSARDWEPRLQQGHPSQGIFLPK